MKISTVLIAGMLLAGFAGSVGCAAGPAHLQISSAFTPELARVFDDAVDYLQNVDGLGGRLATEWQEQTDALSRNADLIAVVRIETVVQGTTVEQVRDYRLSALVSEVITGTPPPDRRVSLRTLEGQAGFNTISGREDRLQTGSYVLFVKWYRDAHGDVRPHWHLTPNSPQLVRRIRVASGIIARQEGEERVVRPEGQ